MGPPQRRETRGGLVDHFLALAERGADERAGALGVAAELEDAVSRREIALAARTHTQPAVARSATLASERS